MKIGIIVAMDKELQQLQQVFKDSDVVVMKSGIGKVNAALGTQRMINELHPDCIISSGCAGGYGDNIEMQDIVISTELCYHDVYCGTAIDSTTQYGQVQGMPVRFKADDYLLSKAMTLPHPLPMKEGDSHTEGQRIKLQPGLIVTGDWFVDTKEKMREIISHFPDARAVDMESAAIAQTCFINKVPFISFRVISDVPLRDTNASMYHNFWENIADRSFQMTKTFVESL